jgi:hypothetical protein
MYQVKLDINTAPLDALGEYGLDYFAANVQESARRGYDAIREPFLAELQFYPKPPSYPYGEFPWKSEKQRKYVLVLLRQQAIARGDYVEGPRGGKQITNLKYQRTFELQRGWFIDFNVQGVGITLSVGNTAQNERGDFIAQFVVGGLNQNSVKEAAAFQQPFHAPRWPLAVERVNWWFDEFETRFIDRVVENFDEFIKTVATRRSMR